MAGVWNPSTGRLRLEELRSQLTYPMKWYFKNIEITKMHCLAPCAVNVVYESSLSLRGQDGKQFNICVILHGLSFLRAQQVSPRGTKEMHDELECLYPVQRGSSILLAFVLCALGKHTQANLGFCVCLKLEFFWQTWGSKVAWNSPLSSLKCRCWRMHANPVQSGLACPWNFSTWNTSSKGTRHSGLELLSVCKKKKNRNISAEHQMQKHFSAHKKWIE